MDINGLPMNPASRAYPAEFIQTGVSTIDGLNTPSSAARSCRYSPAPVCRMRLAAQIARQAKVLGDNETFAVVFAAIGITFEESEYFIEDFRRTGAYRPYRRFLEPRERPCRRAYRHSRRR